MQDFGIDGSGRRRLRFWRRGGNYPTPDFLDQAIRVDRFGQVLADARFEAALAVLLHGVGGQHNDRNLLRCPSANFAHGVESVHARHLEIGQDDRIAARCFEREAHQIIAVGDDVATHPGRIEDFPDQILVALVVLGDQHMRATNALCLVKRKMRARQGIGRRRRGKNNVPDRVEQSAGFDGLGQQRVDAESLSTQHGVFATAGGQHDQPRRIGVRGVLPDVARHVDVVDVRHGSVEQHQIEVWATG